MRIKEIIRQEGHGDIKKDEKRKLSGVCNEEGQADFAVKISLMTFENAASLEFLGFKDFCDSGMERVVMNCRERR